VVIDAWMQHPGQTWLDNEMFHSLLRWKPGPWSQFAQPVERTLEAMEEAGVTRGMLCAWSGPQGAMISNQSVAELCQAHPDRFVGVASVDLTRPMTAVAELRRCVEGHGFRALRVLPWLRGLPPDDRRYYRCSPPAASLTSPSAPRSVTPAHSARPIQAGRSRTSITSPWSSPICGSSAVTSACRG
jgi:uncharacterized protein